MCAKDSCSSAIKSEFGRPAPALSPGQGEAGHRAETERIGANKSRRSPEGYGAAQHPCGRLTGRVGPPVKATAQAKVGFHASALSRQ
jgi:hypothetical protein